MLVAWRVLKADTSGATFRLAWQFGSPSVNGRIDPSFTPPRDSHLFKALTAPSHERITTGFMELPILRGELAENYCESICVNQGAGQVLTLVILDKHAEIYGSRAQHWLRKPSPQLDLW